MKKMLLPLIALIAISNAGYASDISIPSNPFGRAEYIGETQLDGADSFVVFEQIAQPQYAIGPSISAYQITITEENGSQASLQLKLTKKVISSGGVTKIAFFSESQDLATSVYIEQISQTTLSARVKHQTKLGTEESVEFSLSAPTAKRAL